MCQKQASIQNCLNLVTSVIVQMPPPFLHVIHNFIFAILANVFVTENGVKASESLLLLLSSFLAPNRPPGKVAWKVAGSWVTVRWDHVKSMDNESAVLGYKVSDTRCHRTLQLSVCCVHVCIGSSVCVCMSSEYLTRFSNFN